MQRGLVQPRQRVGRGPAVAHPAAASSLLAQLVDGADRSLRLVGRTPGAIHLATGEPGVPLVAVTAPGAVRLPASLQPAGAHRGHLPDGPARIGCGRVLLGAAVELRVVRWWEPPRPVLRDVRRALAVWRRAGAVLPRLEPSVAAALQGASTSEPDLVRAAPALVGLGSGLTPSGDDVVAGALVTLRAVARDGGPRARAGALAGSLATAAAGCPTTEVSAALLHDAAHGRCIPELAGFLAALDGGTEQVVRQALQRLLGVGHSSGTALAHGSLIALRTVQPAGEHR